MQLPRPWGSPVWTRYKIPLKSFAIRSTNAVQSFSGAIRDYGPGIRAMPDTPGISRTGRCAATIAALCAGPTQSDRIDLADVFLQIGRLPVEQREVLILAAVEELRYEQIAGALAIPLGTVMSRLSRACDKRRRMALQPSAAPTIMSDRNETSIAS